MKSGKPASRGSANSFFYNYRSDFKLLIMALPGLLFFFVFAYLPMFGIIIAFKKYNFQDGILGSPWNGLDNLKVFFQSQFFGRIVRNTLFLNFLFMSFGLLFQIGFALMLNELKNRYIAKVSNALMFLPFFISWVIVGYFSYAFLNPQYGVINQIMHSIGMHEINWYQTPGVWPAILVICTLWKGTGYGSIIYTATIAGINPEYYEAAIVDGANRWQQIWHITLPMLRPIVVLLTLLSIGGIFHSDFGLIYNISRNSGMVYRTTDVIDTFIYRATVVSGQFNTAAAAGFTQSVIGFILVVLSNYAVKKIEPEYRLF